MKKQWFTGSYVKFAIIFVALIILLVTPMIRGSHPGTESYLNLRLAEDPGIYDDLSFGGRIAAYSWGTPLILSAVPSFLVNLLPLLLGVLSIFVLSRIVKKFTSDTFLHNVVLMIYVFSPTFIYTFSSANNLFVPFFLSLIAFSLFTSEHWGWATALIVALMPLFSIIATTSLLVVLFAYSFLWKGQRKKLFMILLLVGILVSGLYYGYLLYSSGYTGGVSIGDSAEFGVFSQILYDLGSVYGIGIFIMIMSMVGMSSVWEEKYRNKFVFISVGLLFVFSLFWTESLLLLNVFLCYFAGMGLLYLVNRRWTSINFKQFTLILIVCGLLFSGVSQLSGLIKEDPNEGILNALSFMEDEEQGVVFAHYSRGVWINYAGHANVLDENYAFVNDAEERFKDMNALFYSRDLDESMELIEKYDIDYIWIDEGYRDEVFEYDTQGLLFIAEYTKSFNQIYNKGGVEIWRIEKE